MAHCLLFLAPYVTTSSLLVRFQENGTSKAATITAGSRYLRGDGATGDLAKALADALNTAGVGTWTVSVSYNTDNETPLAVVTIAVSGVSSARILWEDVLTTADGMRWGFTGNTSTGLSFVSTTTPTGCWVSDEPYTEDSPRDVRAMSQTVGQDGAVVTTTRGDPHQARRVAFDYVAPERTLMEEEGALSSSFQRWWRDNVGHTLEIHKLAMSSTTELAAASASTKLGGVSWTLAQNSAEEFSPQRLDTGVDLWAWAVELYEVTT